MSYSAEEQAAFDALSAAGLIHWKDSTIFKDKPVQVVRGTVTEVIAAIRPLISGTPLRDPLPYIFQGLRHRKPDVFGDRAFAPRANYSQNPEDYP